VNNVIFSESYITLIQWKVATFTLKKYKQIKIMLTIIKDLPDNVLGVSGEGKITGKDYETVLIPAIAEKFKANKKLRMLYHLGVNFTGFDLSAMIDDAKMGMKHLSAWDRIALVSDHEMINTFAKFFGHMLSCELRIFKNAEMGEAKKWISE
jgi:hypothetical protein